MAQLRWTNVDEAFGLNHPGIHVFRSTDSLGNMPSIAYYVVADLADKSLRINTDTTLLRRITPSAYFERNQHPLVVVNGTFSISRPRRIWMW